MIELYTPNNLKSIVPESIDEDETPRFNINEEMDNALNLFFHHVLLKRLVTNLEIYGKLM